MGWTGSGFFCVLLCMFGDTKPIFNEESSGIRGTQRLIREHVRDPRATLRRLDNDSHFFVYYKHDKDNERKRITRLGLCLYS